MLNVICAKRIVLNPSVKRNAMKRSIRDTPVTISAFSIGMFVTPIKRVRILEFIACMPSAAQVPINVAISAESNAMISVVYNAFIISLFWKRDTYHFLVNPPHLERVLVLLKERTIKVTIGAYRIMQISAR